MSNNTMFYPSFLVTAVVCSICIHTPFSSTPHSPSLIPSGMPFFPATLYNHVLCDVFLSVSSDSTR
ncbi:hypothetical protein P170DRAFT_57226 [Aspergillus steynii IBT 23096]|uniref:Uncharacterized protein n=1 Tax=Aspergillus steynii IBT 23096 TaxID=1392250 RepID=A0A2I2FSH3_9EURO|nr:uncharacterized protein P170DRAFT_57226 [Aspergillus steynii IBT 23096]PLB43583.1 hypothetical protein P170DRAFT_57226 [Aspergillus steynii IBT 23096]